MAITASLNTSVVSSNWSGVRVRCSWSIEDAGAEAPAYVPYVGRPFRAGGTA